ncbi:MAG: hypothetical protein OP8BY_1753 [Candidatus Saccharicenans subterraneus]|uniref:Uncharacterized protein n=1 Tax=Candidatus Saccharicenans subterraneus TaxID=2508984 RepID=A0A3E2BPB7_9BACT|nr:MAG: hypothetical protein OP8BY_1753 [Candidatus Saccharicenans subterraneum]
MGYLGSGPEPERDFNVVLMAESYPVAPFLFYESLSRL